MTCAIHGAKTRVNQCDEGLFAHGLFPASECFVNLAGTLDAIHHDERERAFLVPRCDECLVPRCDECREFLLVVCLRR